VKDGKVKAWAALSAVRIHRPFTNQLMKLKKGKAREGALTSKRSRAAVNKSDNRRWGKGTYHWKNGEFNSE